MTDRLTVAKIVLMKVLVAAVTFAAFFGFRCPARGCPACKMIGH